MATAKISMKSTIILNRIQKFSGGTKSAIIEKALNELDKNIAFRSFNEAYAKLKKNPDAWMDELKEREELEGTLEDELPNEEI